VGASLMPAAVVVAGLWLMLVLFSAPFWGLLAGHSVAGAIALGAAGVPLGAAVGGAARQLGWGRAARATT
jgi:hypothetical protein